MTRRFPHNLEAEASVLGGILLRNEAISLVSLRPEELYDPKHQAVYAAMERVWAARVAIDVVTVENELRQAKQLEAVGGISFLSTLALKVPTADNVAYYAAIVKDAYVARQLIVAASEIVARGYDQVGEVSDFAADAIAAIQRASEGAIRTRPRPVGELARVVFRDLDERMKHGGGITGVPTGFSDIDRALCGLQGSELIILGARPAMGKTALAGRICENAARSGYPVLLLSLEMTGAKITERAMSSAGGVRGGRLRSGELDRDDMMSLTRAGSALQDIPWHIHEQSGLSLGAVRQLAVSFAAEHRAEHGLGLIAVDYLQLMSGSKKAPSREQQVAELSRGLKALAKELGWPVLALAQLNRSLHGRTDKRPLMSDLRESGAVEQDADVILFLYRDVVYDKDTEHPNLAEVIIAKQRNGDTGTEKLVFQPEYTRFSTIARRAQ